MIFWKCRLSRRTKLHKYRRKCGKESKSENMDILITGNTAPIAAGCIDRIESGHRIVCVPEKTDAKEMSRLFEAYDVGMVIYHSYLLVDEECFAELEQLERVLRFWAREKCEKFLYITGPGWSGRREHTEKENMDDTKDTGGAQSVPLVLLQETCEALCRYHSSGENGKVKVCRVPVLYDTGGGAGSFAQWIAQALGEKTLDLPGKKEDTADFLCVEDLLELALRMAEETWSEDYEEVWAGSHTTCTYEMLGELLCEKIPGVTVHYRESALRSSRTEGAPDLARKNYGWYPMHSVEEDFEALLCRRLTAESQSGKKKRHLPGWLVRERGRIRTFLEMAFSAGMAEVLNGVTQQNTVVNFIDFRLAAIVVMGLTGGLNVGILMAVVCGIGYMVSAGSTVQWQVLFYNVENWLPFATYLLLGTVCGYTRDKHADALRNATAEYQLLEKKYEFLSGIYQQVLEKKRLLSAQIICHQNGFGKMYAAARRLNVQKPEEVYEGAIVVLEDVLKNQSAVVYAMAPGGNYICPVVSSGGGNNAAAGIDLQEYPKLRETFLKQQVFVNQSREEGYPACAAPILKNQKLCGMVALWSEKRERMNPDFLNQLRMVTDLIGDALLRALEWNRRECGIEEEVD